jgi:maltooligosyltrehalose trehalohydrolase
MLKSIERRWPIGAELLDGGVHFRVWAPRHKAVTIVFEGPETYSTTELTKDTNEAGYFSGFCQTVGAGAKYRLRLDGGKQLWPDPASRYQPHGPEGPSQVVDPTTYRWRDHQWMGTSIQGLVLYELHIGTFTREGTWAAAVPRLAELAELGVTALEVMPISEFPGEFGWGYDVANQFAPTRLYGTSDDVRRFVDAAHALKLGVILDVVYNHFGTLGEKLLRPFADEYFSHRYKNEWGSAINFDDVGSGPVREFFLTNVRQWIAEYHFDGVRVDATQAFFDRSSPPILLELARAAREAAGSRRVVIIGESEPQNSDLLRPGDAGGHEFDAVWNDDFHHSGRVRMTGRNEAYYSDYEGTADELAAVIRWGYLYQGQRYAWQNKPRGKPALDIAAPRFVNYLQNHDQVANSIRGARLHELTSPGLLRAMTALLLLAPQTPLLFQGQEFGASSPFLYFNDCHGDQAEGVRKGRAKFLAQFPSLASPEAQAVLTDPCDRATFERSKLDSAERARHGPVYQLHRDLLQLRHHDSVLSRRGEVPVECAPLDRDALVLRFGLDSHECRLIVLNFGRPLRRGSIPQPLVAPPAGCHWQMLWSSEDPRYGGSGTPPVETDQGWQIPGQAALVLRSVLMEV